MKENHEKLRTAKRNKMLVRKAGRADGIQPLLQKCISVP
jgi:hypothetical protein